MTHHSIFKKWQGRMAQLALPLLLAAATSGISTGCSDDDLDPQSIFKDDLNRSYNAFDEWLRENYSYPYGIEFQYKMEQLNTDLRFNLAPVSYDNAQILAKLFKHVWIEAYNEVAGTTFTRAHLPREISLIGSDMFGSETGNPGLSEDGVKVTLYKCNFYLLQPSYLNRLFLHNLHHAMVHYMLADKPIDSDYQRLSDGKYQYNDWYLRSYIDAYKDGFITPYAGGYPDDDVAEMVSVYLTSEDEDWNNFITYAGETGGAILRTKMDIVERWMQKSWGIDIERLRSAVSRRMKEVTDRKVDLTPIDPVDPSLPDILY